MSKEKALEIFEAGIDANDNRDTIIVTMVQEGISLNTAQNLYKEFAAEAGISSRKVGYKAEALEYIGQSDLDITNDEDRATLRKELQEKFEVATSTTNDYIKAYAAQEGIELPTSNFGSNPEEKAKIVDWVCNHPNCNKAEFKAFMEDEMNRGSGSIDETWRGIVLARTLQDRGVTFAEEAVAA